MKACGRGFKSPQLHHYNVRGRSLKLSERPFPLENQVSIAGRGLGHAIARAFAHDGARLVVHYRASRDAAEDLARSLGPARAMALQADVTDAAQLDDLFAKAKAHLGGGGGGGVTTVVNNALADFSFDGDACEGRRHRPGRFCGAVRRQRARCAPHAAAEASDFSQGFP
jgi:NAD(P)-dependent dehydrogenase (short-subunit alcohol dehydrogenase family)